jgi:hypothetical protein
MFDFAQVNSKPLFSRGLNSKYLANSSYVLRVKPSTEMGVAWAWYGSSRGLTRKGVVGA